MKKLIICATICLFINTINSQAQTENRSTGTAMKVKGIPVFVMSEPTAAYEVTGNVTDEDVASTLNAISGTETYRTIRESCEVIVNNAMRKQKKGKFEFDAVVISDDGHAGTCIKFK